MCLCFDLINYLIISLQLKLHYLSCAVGLNKIKIVEDAVNDFTRGMKKSLRYTVKYVNWIKFGQIKSHECFA